MDIGVYVKHEITRWKELIEMLIYIFGKFIWVEFGLIFSYMDKQSSKNHKLFLKWRSYLVRVSYLMESTEFESNTIWYMSARSFKVFNFWMTDSNGFEKGAFRMPKGNLKLIS